MANYITGLQCQKCRTSLKVDGSLEPLNPASFNILADAAPALRPKAPEPPRSAAAKERRQLYSEVSRHAGASIPKRNVSSVQKTPNRHEDPEMSFIMLPESGSSSPEAPRSAAAKERMKASHGGFPPLELTSSSGKINPEMSYIMLSESQMMPEPLPVAKSLTRRKSDSKSFAMGSQGGIPLSQEMETTMRLFEILSARSDIDHPICSECTELLLENLQKRQAGITREREAYVDFLKKAQQDIPTEREKVQTRKDLENAHQREEQALRELEALEAEKAQMEEELAALDEEAETLDAEEEVFWRDRNAFSAELANFQQQRDSLQNQLAHDNKVLEALQRTNVYNDTFCIGHDGTFGTINGLRLGRTSEHSVDWPEINAAWGQTLLLLTVVIEKLSFRLRGYELEPVGSTSKVVRVDDSQTADGQPKKTILELHSNGDLPLGLGFLRRNFDDAMVAFLECLRQAGEHVAQSPTGAATGLKMPYPIKKDKIGDVSIKLGNFGQGQGEYWTKAFECWKHVALVHTVYSGQGVGHRLIPWIIGGIIGFGFATVGGNGVDWSWGGVSQVFAAWFIAPCIAACFGALIFTFTKYGVIKRKNALRCGMLTVPLYFGLTTGILTMLIVWKGAASLDLDDWGVAPTVGTIFGVAGGCALLSIIFLLPYIHVKLEREDWTLKTWEIIKGPLLLRRPAPGLMPAGHRLVPDYYEGHHTRVQLDTMVRDVETRSDEESLDRAEVEADGIIKEGKMEAYSHNNTQANMVAPAELPIPIERKWYEPHAIWNKACYFFFRGVYIDIVAEQSGKSNEPKFLQRLLVGKNLADKHALVMHYDEKVEHLYSFLQVLTAATGSFAHGANDVANAMGPLSAIHNVWMTNTTGEDSPVPIWILVFGGASIAVGLWTYGYNLMRNLGNRITLHSPVRGFSMELGAAVTVVLATRLALPVSTTQCIIGATVGVGLCSGEWKAINWRMVTWSYSGWFITLPSTALISGLIMAFVINAPQWGRTPGAII